jgi:hypothetical protein
MGLLTLFSKAPGPLLRHFSGSFTVDREGTVVISTLPSSFPGELIDEIAHEVLATFRGAETASLPLSELNVNYPSLQITARELRGGAIVFLTPKALYAPAKQR